ncbi:MAG: (2Fe-2S)-binding protein [Gammaproteobacteria bacterium]|nr:(2Fe-2S)-binding protein [Gammaproteobacteria bacterium]
MSINCDIAFTLNGVKREITVPAAMTALEMLRERLGLTGTKYGCGEGECGACTILVDGATVNSCLMFAVDCDGRDLVTVEGVVTRPAGERLRDAFVAHGAVQCGFCTPGLVVQASHLIVRDHAGNEAAIRRGIEGNLCRCTGYRKIIEAIAAAADAATQGAEHGSR